MNFKFTKKEFVVEAVQHQENPIEGTVCVPSWFIDAILTKQIVTRNKETFILHLDKDQKLNEGDWVVKLPDKRLTAYDDKTFRQLYCGISIDPAPFKYAPIFKTFIN